MNPHPQHHSSSSSHNTTNRKHGEKMPSESDLMEASVLSLAHGSGDPRYPCAPPATVATAVVATAATSLHPNQHDAPNNINSSNTTEYSSSHYKYVRNPHDHSLLLDHHGAPVTIDRLLATKPLKGELSVRPGPAGRSLTYLSGDSVTRTLNDIFGFDGWHLQIVSTEKTVCERVESSSKSGGASKGSSSWLVAYTAHVRITHTHTATYKEDVGAGDSQDRNLPTALQHALKAAVTDALKRAARHFGDKLGNSLYQGSFRLQSAPVTLRDALDGLDRERGQRHPWLGTTAATTAVVATTVPPQQHPSKTNTTMDSSNSTTTHHHKPGSAPVPQRPAMAAAATTTSHHNHRPNAPAPSSSGSNNNQSMPAPMAASQRSMSAPPVPAAAHHQTPS